MDTPNHVARRVLTSITIDQLAFIADPARGDQRGLPTLATLIDIRRLLIDSGAPETTSDAALQPYVDELHNALLAHAEQKLPKAGRTASLTRG